jgi:hypothetical protein
VYEVGQQARDGEPEQDREGAPEQHYRVLTNGDDV